MSTLKVNKLRDTAGSADAITLDPNGGAVLAGVTTVTSVKVGAAVTISESGIEASGIGITCANLNGGQIGGRRNIIINGDMRIAQRGTSRSATSQGTSYATVDRFMLQWNDFGVQATETQGDVGTSDTPYTLGFRKYHRITLASAGTAAAGTYVEFKYLFEAQDIANSGWNYTSPSSFITFSFWFRCSTNQTFYTTFRTKDGTEQGYAFSFTATGNNEWTKVVHTIPGNSNLQFDNNNESGLIFYIFPALGTSYSNDSKSLNAWSAFSGSAYCPDMADTWLTAGASTFDLTGVQLEVGSQATAFEHRSFGEELSLCQRYYYLLVSGVSKFMCMGDFWTAGQADGGITLPVAMRSTPTLDHTNGADYYKVWTNTTSSNIDGTVTLWNTSNDKAVTWYATPDTNRTAGHSARWVTNNSSAHFAFSAEL